MFFLSIDAKKKCTSIFVYGYVRNDCNNMVRKAKRKNENKLAEDCKRKPKNFWRYVQKKVKTMSGISPLLTDSGHLAVTNEEKANTLNAFFASVFTRENIDDNVPFLQEGGNSQGMTVGNQGYTSCSHRETGQIK